jgi:Tfp pilus assembly protein PilO
MKELLVRFSAYFARLSSLERRFIVVAIVVGFVVVNLWFVFPRFNDWGEVRNRHETALATRAKYEKEIAQTATYTSQISKLESEGVSVPLEDQSLNILTTINSQAVQSGVSILNNSPQPERTNQFFLERAQGLTIQSGESQLVDFLYKLGDGNSLIRVRALSLRPDAPRHNLAGNLTLIASYQKKPSARPAARPAAAPASASAAAVKTNKPPAPAASKLVTPTRKK